MIAAGRPSSDRVFYTGMSFAILAGVFVGFAPSYFLRGVLRPAQAPLSPLLHVHGAAFTCWVLLFVAQAVLVARGRVDVHRKLGVAGALLAAAMVVIGLSAAIDSAQRGVAAGNAGALRFLAIPVVDMLVFPSLVAAGIFFRRQPETHKRLMLLATLTLFSAAVARWPLAILAAGPAAFFPLTDVFVLAGVVHDLWSRGRVHPVYLWAGSLFVVLQPLRLWLSDTDAWLAFARTLVP